ncbi:hypothetical protein PGT21_036015 [Puccinia graminis f. sp. tritici]|uniref:Uncharacterized protein n=1 Tax=Puccinia graminis f. sp. tritici TaxID=56615 RepID=A0A5B0P2G1_PUCGR|nr:hypothetical protein PGT21_036015 [Puccinia graminis f. sp. tritici]
MFLKDFLDDRHRCPHTVLDTFPASSTLLKASADMLASPPACGGGVQSYSAKGQSALYKTLRSQSLDCQFPASIPFIPFPRKHLGAIVYNLIPSKVLKLHQEVVSLASSEKSELVPFLLYEENS